MSKITENVKAHTDFLEALEIIQKWQEKSPRENKQLNRLAELVLAMLSRHQDLMLEVSDANLAYTLIKNENNKIKQDLKGL
tara:strand:- start:292 stop:534 length:243 start_codon:yes stop_codon:yes gene_type:complete